jgi:hypothetical protein
MLQGIGDGLREGERVGGTASFYSMLFSTKARTMASTWVLASVGIMSARKVAMSARA